MSYSGTNIQVVTINPYGGDRSIQISPEGFDINDMPLGFMNIEVSIDKNRRTEMFMPSLHINFPKFSDRKIDLAHLPGSITVDGYEFTLAYQEELAEEDTIRVHTYYKLNVGPKAPEAIFARYVVFSEHALKRMEKRTIPLSHVLKAFLCLNLLPRKSYDDTLLANYKDIMVVFKTTAEGVHQIITTYKVDDIYRDCFLESIQAVNLNGTAKDLYDFCRRVVDSETNKYRVGKAALNIIKLILQGSVYGKNLYAHEKETESAFDEIWEMFEVARANGHPDAFCVMDGAWAVLKSIGFRYQFLDNYGRQYQKLRLQEFGSKSHYEITAEERISDALAKNPLYVPALLECLIIRLLDHACNQIKFTITKHIFSILAFEKDLPSLLVLHMFDNYARLNHMNRLRTVLKPYIDLENDRAFIEKHPSWNLSLFPEFINWQAQLIEEYMPFDRVTKRTFSLHLISVGLQLHLRRTRLEILGMRMGIHWEWDVATLLAMVPEDLDSIVNELDSLALEEVVEEQFRGTFAEMFVLQAQEYELKGVCSFTLQLLGVVDVYKQCVEKLFCVYIPILVTFDKAEKMLMGYQGSETLEERQAILKGHARDLFIHYFMAIAYKYASKDALPDFTSNQKGIELLLGDLSLLKSEWSEEARSALTWFDAQVIGVIEAWDFLSMGQIGQEGYSLIQQLRNLLNIKGAPTLFKLYVSLFIAQYAFYIGSNKTEAKNFLEFSKKLLRNNAKRFDGRVEAFLNSRDHLDKVLQELPQKSVEPVDFATKAPGKKCRPRPGKKV